MVRRAGPDDVPWLLTQLRAFASAYPIPLPIYGSDAHAEVLLGTLMEHQYLAIAARPDGTRTGLIAGCRVQHPFNPDLWMVSELWWWVTPEDRGSSAGLKLLASLEAWADEQAMPFALTTEATTALNDRHLAKRGYVPVERQFIRLPHPVS